MGYLKRLAMPVTWPLERKRTTWITKPLGPHPLKFCVPINVILRDILKITQTTHETKKLLVNEILLVNNTRIKDYRRGIGLFDILAFPSIEKYYTLIITRKGKLKLIEIQKTEIDKKLEKIKNKRVVKDGKIQLTFHDGRTILASNDYKVNDSVIFDLKEKKISRHLPLTIGASVYVIGGKYIGNVGKYIDKIRKGNKNFVILEITGQKREVFLQNIFVIDKKTEEKLVAEA